MTLAFLGIGATLTKPEQYRSSILTSGVGFRSSKTNVRSGSGGSGRGAGGGGGGGGVAGAGSTSGAGGGGGGAGAGSGGSAFVSTVAARLSTLSSVSTDLRLMSC